MRNSKLAALLAVTGFAAAALVAWASQPRAANPGPFAISAGAAGAGATASAWKIDTATGQVWLCQTDPSGPFCRKAKE